MLRLPASLFSRAAFACGEFGHEKISYQLTIDGQTQIICDGAEAPRQEQSEVQEPSGASSQGQPCLPVLDGGKGILVHQNATKNMLRDDTEYVNKYYMYVYFYNSRRLITTIIHVSTIKCDPDSQ